MSILQEIDKFESRMDQLIKSIIDKLPTEKVEESKPVAETENATKYRSKNEQDDYDRLLVRMNERWKRLDKEKRKSEEIRPYKRFKTNPEDFDSYYEYMSDGW